MPANPSLRPRPAGFTLLELLVTVAILGVLASLLLPALATTRRRADALRCAENLRQIGLGLRLYADDDTHGRLPGEDRSGPPPVGLDPRPSWIFTLGNAIENVERLRLCPGDSLRAWLRTNAGCSYVLNEYTSADAPHESTQPAPLVDPEGHRWNEAPRERRLDLLPRPAETFLVFEASRLGQLLGDARTRPDTWALGWPHVLADIDPHRHGRGANYLFADGHVAAIPAVVLKARIERGDNFAVPPR
ncbi:MAG: prepilin-type N-terminal cleavage/methylation domain-containing protein [Verrucomicrobiae bacterium]|nr:prepilin-type N-terminal cleavage/methylation domain-containing protein [Verrucomicrobiae bacterium]